jgi:hypothetical protein
LRFFHKELFLNALVPKLVCNFLLKLSLCLNIFI